MRVGLDLVFLEPGRTGGRETYVRELCAALRVERPDVELVAFGGEDLRGDGWWRACCDEVRVLRGVRAASRPLWARAELLGLPRAAARAGVDVLHGPANFGPVSGPFGRVLTVHDVLFAELPDAVPLASRVPTALMVRAAARRADVVVCVSHAAAARVAEVLGLDGERVVVVPNGVAEPALRGDARRGAALVGRSGFVLSVASHLPHKDLALLPDGVVKAGAGTEALPGGLGAVDAQTLEDLYAACAAVVLPTRMEGFGFPVLEALLRGVPVACTDLPVLREVAGGHAELFAAGDRAGCEAAIARAVARGRGDAASAQHARTFTWARAALATAAAYERALRGHAAKAH